MNKRFILLSSIVLFTACPTLPSFADYSTSTEAYETSPVGKIEFAPENLPPNATFDSKSALNFSIHI